MIKFNEQRLLKLRHDNERRLERARINLAKIQARYAGKRGAHARKARERARRKVARTYWDNQDIIAAFYKSLQT